jgi:zinc protease
MFPRSPSGFPPRNYSGISARSPRATREYQPTREEQLEMKKVTLADVRKFHDQFYGASHGEFVGGRCGPGCDAEARRGIIQSWTTPGPTPLPAYKKVEAINRKIET